jgi:hypothetical protein
MNGYKSDRLKVPLFMEGVELPDSFYDPPDPYTMYTPLVKFDLPALSRYARSAGKEIVDITKEEFQLFVKE